MLTEQHCLELVKQIAQGLSKSSHSLALAESCTGGWGAKICTDFPGSSKWFKGGVVAYGSEVKQRVLNIQPDILQKFGAVSPQVAGLMVVNLLQKIPATMGVAITGIAGPENRPEKERIKSVGHVCFAWGTKYNYLHTEVVNFQGNREAIRLQSLFYGLSGIQQLIKFNL